jgi:hypothetical protein
MKKTLAVLVMVIMAVGFDWSLLQGSHDEVQVAGGEGSAVSFMTSVATLNYQGQKAQNRVQTVSLAKIERQTSSTGATYALSGEGGFRIGKDGTAAFYGLSPITVSRNLSDDRLSSDEKGLSLWLTVINGTLNGLTHKHMASGAWEEPITLSLGDAFPETIQARFRAQPLPEPDSKWILITADSGLISFRALDEKYQDSLIYGRYRGVLVYSPTEDEFLQAAAVFVLYHGEDQFRIEQLHFAADQSGKQLYPVLDVGSYLDFKPEAPTIATQGAFPSWCVQATQVLDILHLAIMTAAEGSTNWGPVIMVDQSLLNLINHDYRGIAKWLGQAAADDYLRTWAKIFADQFFGDWMKALNFINTQRKEGTAKAGYELAKDLSKDFILKRLPFGLGTMYQYLELVKTVSQAVQDKMAYDINNLTSFRPAPKPVVVPTEPPKPSQPPPDKVKKAPASAGGDSLLWLELIAGALGLAAGAYELGLIGGGDESVDCEWFYSTVRPLSKIACEWMEEEGDPYIFSVPLECGCPNGTKDTGGRSTNPNGMKMMTCKGCF